MENSIKILRQIESTHHGLGASILFGCAAYLANVSVLYLGEKGTGKGATISTIKCDSLEKTVNPTTGELESKYDMIIDNLTLTEMGNKNELQNCYHRKIVWRIKEWSTMNKYNRELFLTVGAKIITDREYYHYMGEKRKIPIIIDIKDTDLICFIGITPLKMSKLMSQNENWESLASDRFIKWTMINPLRTESLDYHPMLKMPDINYDIKPVIKTEMSLIKRLLTKQISDERLQIFSKKLLTGWGILNGCENIGIKEELMFCKLFQPYIRIYPNMVYSIELEEEDKLAVGSMRLFSEIVKHNGISLDELEQSFSVYQKKMKTLENAKEMISRHSQLLTDKKMINVIENSPKKFYMSNDLTNYFDWYAELIK